MIESENNFLILLAKSKSMKLFLSLIIFFSFSLNSLSAQEVAEEKSTKVFQLGDDEKNYEKLARSYSLSLLEACNNDIKKAFEKWLEMMVQVDTYAKKINYDLKGVKVWLHVFWGEDGNIDNIGYLLRPDSRNIDSKELKAFLASFSRQYKFPVSANRKFSHYTGATFPTFKEKMN